MEHPGMAWPVFPVNVLLNQSPDGFQMTRMHHLDCIRIFTLIIADNITESAFLTEISDKYSRNSMSFVAVHSQDLGWRQE